MRQSCTKWSDVDVICGKYLAVMSSYSFYQKLQQIYPKTRDLFSFLRVICALLDPDPTDQKQGWSMKSGFITLVSKIGSYTVNNKLQRDTIASRIKKGPLTWEASNPLVVSWGNSCSIFELISALAKQQSFKGGNLNKQRKWVQKHAKKHAPHFTPTENILAGGQKRRDIRSLQIHVSGQVSEFLSRNVTHKK